MKVWPLRSKFILTKECRLYNVKSKCWFDCSKSCMFQGSKKPIPCIVWGLLVSSVRKLLEKVGDLRDIAILVQSNFGIFDIYWPVLNLVKLSRIIILYFLFYGFFTIEIKIIFLYFGFIGYSNPTYLFINIRLSR